jgi:hypothetical protein
MPVASSPAIVIWVCFWLNARSRCVLGLILFLRWLLAGKVKVFVKEALLIERTFFLVIGLMQAIAREREQLFL